MCVLANVEEGEGERIHGERRSVEARDDDGDDDDDDACCFADRSWAGPA
jgi:hypothetical protein